MRRTRMMRAVFAWSAMFCATGIEAQQVPLSQACQTPFGVCPAPVAPVGALCTCFGPRGPDAGRMIYAPPPQQAGAPNVLPLLSNLCRTPFGVCQMPFQAPVSTQCACMGPRGPDPGQVIGGWR